MDRPISCVFSLRFAPSPPVPIMRGLRVVTSHTFRCLHTHEARPHILVTGSSTTSRKDSPAVINNHRFVDDLASSSIIFVSPASAASLAAWEISTSWTTPRRNLSSGWNSSATRLVGWLVGWLVGHDHFSVSIAALAAPVSASPRHVEIWWRAVAGRSV